MLVGLINIILLAALALFILYTVAEIGNKFKDGK